MTQGFLFLRSLSPSLYSSSSSSLHFSFITALTPLRRDACRRYLHTNTNINERDLLLKSFTPDYRLAVINNTGCIQEAIDRHGIRDPREVVLLGKTMAAASLMASFLKGEERVTVSLHFSNGRLESVVGQGLKSGDVRGHLQYAPEDLSPELRTDNVTVSQVLYNKAKPIASVAPLAKGDVSSDIQNYFNQSEQNLTITHLETLFDERKGKVEFSGGFFLQPFPFHDDCLELLEAGRSRVSNLGLGNEEETGERGGGVTLFSLLQKFGMNRFANLILLGDEKGLEIVNQSQETQKPKVREDTTISPVRFQCHCSLDAFKSQLLNLGSGTLMEMEHQGQNSMVCHFCSTEYKLTPKDFEELQTQLRSLETQPKQ